MKKQSSLLLLLALVALGQSSFAASTSNPFAVDELSSLSHGNALLAEAKAKCGTGSCGGKKKLEAHKCGTKKLHKANHCASKCGHKKCNHKAGEASKAHEAHETKAEEVKEHAH